MPSSHWRKKSNILPLAISSPEVKSSSQASTPSPVLAADGNFSAAATTGDGAVGLANPQMSGQRRRMLDLVNGLHSTGVQVDIDLPQIAVVGNQSAGKSSLIESISGITLPRASGTCTRCPTECRLSYSPSPWKCTVSLRITTDAKGQPLGQSRNEAFGDPIFDKKDVEDRIRRAQLAILNPDKPAKSFLTDDDVADSLGGSSSESGLTFSMNCVSLTITGPGVADLSFVDLPGLIASVGRGGNSGDIKLVEGLVTAYIKRSNCIILLTVACETDFENQGAHQLAKQYDPEGKRTIGVLTKPDRIPTGEEQNWLQFIRNEKEPLQNNWYCVKQPSSNDLKQNWTWEQARQKEDEFFLGTSPWNEIEPLYARYLRTKNLVERLSQVLSELIAKRLPEIQQEIETMIAKTRQQIELLPKPPPQNALNEVAKLIKDFDADMKRHIEGVPYKEGIIQRIRVPCKKFRRVIRATAPEFRPFDRPRYGRRDKTLAEPEFLKHEEESAGQDDLENSPLEDEDEGFEDSVASSGLVYVDEVYRRMEESVSRELPGHFPFIVEREYIRGTLMKWDKPATILCESVYRILINQTKDLVRQHFSTFGQGMLEHQIRLIMHEHLGSCLEAAKKKIVWLMNIQADPFTLNNHYMADYKEKFLTYYRRVRQDARTKDNGLGAVAEAGNDWEGAGEDPTAAALSALAKLGYEIKKEDLGKLLAQDMMEPALVIMASVRAYFQVAYKRFVDNVPMAIDYELVRGGEIDVFQLLWTKLELDGQDARQMCEEYAQEAAQVADRREELEKKLERLTEATKRLIG
ncbi:hypothetical protein D9756_005579 [Leucocoprinus leucothites]|uniref:Uncharacterized protein n=1 Tax=Leucocoprinus leucothites TaxID=201217 RepID=A0A8H5G066_9AGAR|nr:hypothetical protein D9756_005579 [Leucoagaricus leucothites]